MENKEENKALREEPKLEATNIQQLKFHCPTCGETTEVIHSTIPQFPGAWCMVCALKWMDSRVPRVSTKTERLDDKKE